MTKSESKPELEFEQPSEGIEIAPGRFKTSRGTIVVPKARQKKLAQKAGTVLSEDMRPFEPTSAAPPAREPERTLPEINTGKPEQVTFKTPLGLMTATYNPVIDLQDWVVLGTTPQSFVPTSYKENKNLSFEMEGPSVKKCKVVFTGCKFQEPFSRTTYIVLMKV